MKTIKVGRHSRLPGMGTLKDTVRAFFLYPVSYLCWFLGITNIVRKIVSGWPCVIVMNYHRVNEKTGPDAGGYPGNITSVFRFRKHIEYLKRNYCFIKPGEIAEYISGERKLARDHILITFDDGYRDSYQFGLHILQQYDASALFFITAGIFKNDFIFPADRFSGYDKTVHYSGSGRPERLYLDSSELKVIVQKGYGVGSHTVTHPVLDDLQLEMQRNEITKSRRILEDRTGTPVLYFSYPIGGISDETPGLVKEAGYQLAFGNLRGIVSDDSDRYNLPRVSACDYPVPVFAFKIIMVKLLSLLRRKKNYD
jgi:peptidoglycan/xylan/chitin deacetylase (PgdA/CDA1 family)